MTEVPNEGRTLPFEIEFDVRPQYLYVTVRGDRDTYEVSYAYWMLILQEIQRCGRRKILVCENFPEALSLSEMYRLSSDLTNGMPSNLRVAFVDEDISQFDANEFAVLVAKNRGANVRIMKSFEEAEQWLLVD